MANCTNCGKALKEGAKFCPSCGAAVKGGSAASSGSNNTEGRTNSRRAHGSGGSMGTLAMMVVRVACIAIVVCFFLPYYSQNYLIDTFRVSGASIAFGIDKNISISVMGYSTKVPVPVPARPALLFVPLIALAVLAAMHLPKVREKIGSINVPFGNVPVIGGMGAFSYLAIIAALLGLIFLGAANLPSAAGIGFIITLLADIAILAMPFVDKYLLSKNRG